VPSCVIAYSDSPNAFETVAAHVVPGQVIYIYVDSFAGQTANPRITDFASYTGVALSSIESGSAAIVANPFEVSQP